MRINNKSTNPHIISSIILLLISSIWVNAQTKIIVLDKEDNSKLQYVTIYNTSTQKRTLTDNAGTATITGDKKDSIQISFLGYTTRKTIIADLKSNHTVLLKRAPFVLTEVQIKARPLITQLLKNCQKYMEQSFNRPAYEQKAFLKERVFEPDGYIVGYLDGLINIYNGAYSDKFDKDALRFLNTDLETITDFRRSQYPDYFTTHPKYDNYEWVNIPNLLDLFAMKKGFLHRKLFEPDFVKFYDFEYTDGTLEDGSGDYIYRIKFKLKDGEREKAISEYARNKSNNLYSGELLINSVNYALVGFSVDQAGYESYIRAKAARFPVKKVSVSYVRIGSRYLLNNIVEESVYKRDDLNFTITDDLNIVTESQEPLSEDQILTKYGKTDIYRGVRIRAGRSHVDANPYDASKWENYQELITPKIRADLERKYNFPLEKQFAGQNIIYNNVKAKPR